MDIFGMLYNKAEPVRNAAEAARNAAEAIRAEFYDGFSSQLAEKAGLLLLTNGVTNPDFASDVSGWQSAGTTSLIVSTALYLSGTKSLKFNLLNNFVYTSQDISYTNGHKIYVAAWSYLESASNLADTLVTQRMGVSDYGTAATNIVRPTYPQVTGAWVRASTLKTAASGGVRVTLGRGSNTTAVYYFDCILAFDASAIFGDDVTADQIDEVLDAAFTNGWILESDTISLSEILSLIKNKASVEYVDGKNDSVWYAKTLNIIGDSIVASGAGTTNFADVAAASVGISTVNNYGINGSQIAVQESSPTTRDPIVTRFDDMADGADINIVSAGTNDWQYALCPVGTMADRTNYTFYGALHNLCLGLMKKYELKTILFLTPIQRRQYPLDAADSTNANGKTLRQYCDIIIQVCRYYGIAVLDMYAESGLYPFDDDLAVYYYEAEVDGESHTYYTHVKAATGHVMMARRLAGCLRQLA